MKITSVDVMKIPSEDPSFSGNGQGLKKIGVLWLSELTRMKKFPDLVKQA